MRNRNQLIFLDWILIFKAHDKYKKLDNGNGSAGY